jgi:hypothetical protein
VVTSLLFGANILSALFSNTLSLCSSLTVRDTHTELQAKLYKVLFDSFWTVIVVSALVKEDERGGQGQFSFFSPIQFISSTDHYT